MKKDAVKVIPLEKLQENDGQLDWLPRNPRQWTQTDIDRTKRSLDEDADFMQDRPILAVPGKDKGTFIAFAGNLRLHSARDLGWPGAPVVVYHPEDQIDRETVIRRAVKDNGAFGSWDTDILANEWPVENMPLEDWGVPEWITGGAGKAETQQGPSPSPSKTGEVDPGSLDPLVDLKIGLRAEEFSFVKRALGEAGETDREGLLNLLGYEPGE